MDGYASSIKIDTFYGISLIKIVAHMCVLCLVYLHNGLCIVKGKIADCDYISFRMTILHTETSVSAEIYFL